MARAVGVVMGVTLVTAIGLPGIAAAAPTPLYTQCPAVGLESGCAVLVTVNADGSTTVSTDPNQPPLTATSTTVLVGFVNNSDGEVTNVGLSGPAPGPFHFTGQGVCTVHPGPCINPTANGTTGYEGPSTSFTTGTDPTTGTVNFTGGMQPDTSAYFSLAGAPTSVANLGLVSNLSVTATPVTAYAGVPFSGQVGTFTLGYSSTPLADFTATMDWGDGTTPSMVAVTQPGGPYTPYVVTGSHTYASATTTPVTTQLTINDTVLTTVSGSAQSTATVSNQPVTLSPVALPAQVVGTPFTVPVATFTSTDLGAPPGSFTALIDWGAQANGTEQTSTGTVTQGPGSSYTVIGSNDYAASGDLTVTVSVTIGGLTTSLTEPITVQAIQQTVPCTGSCTGQVTTPLETSTVTTSSGTGSVTVALSDGSLQCAGNYSYAPQVTTVSTSNVSSTTTVRVKITFLRKNLLVQGTPGAALGVCFQANHPFKQLDGTTTLPTTIDGQTQYVGLLPRCNSLHPRGVGPCLALVSVPIPGWKTVQENLVFPAGDPRAH